MALDLRRAFDLATSFGVSAARLASGMSVSGTGKRPTEPLALYEFEACPFCRKVRETLSVLDLGALTDVTMMFAGVWRATAGMSYHRARAPEQALELWSFEASPFCRLVREALCRLELPYRLHNVAKGSARREAFVARSGKMMVPYLVDPNTGTAMFESADIVRYLDATYAL